MKKTLGALFCLVAIIALTACEAPSDNPASDTTPAPTSAAVETPPEVKTPTPAKQTGETGQAIDAGDGKTYAILATTAGVIKIELYTKRAPKTCANFIGLATGTKEWLDPATNQLVKRPFYDGLIFHRVIAGFMIQGGCPLGTGSGNPGYQFEDEFDLNLRHVGPGVLSMANSGPGTNGSQFFITVASTPELDGKHSIFGRVADESSLDNVYAISLVEKDVQDRPLVEMKINSIKIVIE